MRVSDKARVRQRRVVHGVLILISFSLMFLGKADLAALRNLRMGSNDFLAPIVDVVSAPIRGIETMIEGVRTVASLRAENVRLQGENDLLKRWRRRAEILESENRQLRSVTGAATVANRTPITARAVTAPGGGFAHTVLISIGSEKGIERGNPAVTADGLVGIVIDVGRAYARVLLISDINARVPVILASSSWPGLSVGQNGQFLDLQFLPDVSTNSPIFGLASSGRNCKSRNWPFWPTLRPGHDDEARMTGTRALISLINRTRA